MVGLVVVMLAAAGRVKVHHVEGGAPTDLPEVAVCIAGAARSFATVPILRALKRNVLQSTSYSASAFAALSYDTFSPQVRSGGASHACAIASHMRALSASQGMEYNVTLMRFLSMRQVVRRALLHLQPELKAVTYYNSSDARHLFQPCHPEDTDQMPTYVASLYSMQLCHALVRQHEVGRGDERFDFIIRVRPDHLFVHPLATALRVNVSSWPLDRVLAPRGVHAMSFAIMPSGPVAALYFRTFTHATSCLFRNKVAGTSKAALNPLSTNAEHLPQGFKELLQCSSKPTQDGQYAACVFLANLHYHALSPPVECARPALIARVCNVNESTKAPSWPAWPMPRGETCVTRLDMLKRPQFLVRQFLRNGAPGTPAEGSNFTLVAVVLCSLGAVIAFRRRLYNDVRDVLSQCEPMCPAFYDQAAPLAEQSMAALDEAVERGAKMASKIGAILGGSAPRRI